jgi:hypothetical protein
MDECEYTDSGIRQINAIDWLLGWASLNYRNYRPVLKQGCILRI